MRAAGIRAGGASLLLAAIVGSAAPAGPGSPTDSGVPGRQTSAGLRVEGLLLGSDGAPISVSHAHLQDYATAEVLAAATAGEDGTWSIDAPRRGVFLLWLSGVGHRGERVGLLLDGSEPVVRVEARLTGPELRAGLAGAVAIGDFDGFRSDAPGIPLRPGRNGVLSAQVGVGADSLAYAIRGATWTGTLAGTAADSWVYDGTGGYRSVVRPAGGSARLELDPERLPAPGGAGFLRLEPRDGPAGQFAALTRDVFARVDAYFERRARASAAGATVAEMRRIYETYDPSPDADAVARRLAVVEDPGLRAWMMAAYLAAPIRTDSLLARRALRDISPASPAWGLDPRALPEALSASGTPETARVYAGSVEAEHPDPAVRASALAFLLEDALAADREADLADLYDRLIRSYPDSKPAAKARELYAPDRRIQPGRRVPAFSVTTMDDPPLLVSNESLRGKVVLMDFWATWCGPCITEMPYLHRAFEKYGPAGFTILSVSFDLAPEDVTRYRTEGDWTMPWLHAWVDLGTDSELAKRMDIVNIPRAILFDAEGRILATNEDLRGRRLDETLSRALAGETEP